MPKKQPNPVDLHVGNRVRARRRTLGLSQEKLAEAVGVTFQQVQKYENGTNRIGSSRLQQIAAAMAIPISYFFEDVPGQTELSKDAPSSSWLTEFLTTSEGPALVKAFVKIRNRKLRRKIVDIVSALADAES